MKAQLAQREAELSRAQAGAQQLHAAFAQFQVLASPASAVTAFSSSSSSSTPAAAHANANAYAHAHAHTIGGGGGGGSGGGGGAPYSTPASAASLTSFALSTAGSLPSAESAPYSGAPPTEPDSQRHHRPQLHANSDTTEAGGFTGSSPTAGAAIAAVTLP